MRKMFWIIVLYPFFSNCQQVSLGDLCIEDLYVGSDGVTKVYMGDKEIWPLEGFNFYENSTVTEESLAAQNNDMSGGFMRDDGVKYYAVGRAGGNRVYQYNMSTPGSLSSMTYENKSFSFSAQTATRIWDVAFRENGTRMYALAQNGIVYQYNLSTAWDVTTAIYQDNQNIGISVAGFYARALRFSQDGTQAFMVESNASTNNPDQASRITRIIISTAWDITGTVFLTTYSPNQIDPNLSGFLETTLSDIEFSQDGRLLFLLSQLNGIIYQYDLTTPWTITTAQYRQQKDNSILSSFISQMDFTGDGGVVVLMDYIGDTLYSFETAGSSAYVENCIKDATVFINPSNTTLNYQAQTLTVNIFTNGTWTLSDNQTWITPAAGQPTSGAGNASVAYNIAANTGATIRNGVITVTTSAGSDTVQITQSVNNTTTLTVWVNNDNGKGGCAAFTGALDIYEQQVVIDNTTLLNSSSITLPGGQPFVLKKWIYDPATSQVAFVNTGDLSQQEDCTIVVATPSSINIPNTSGSFNITYDGYGQWNYSDTVSWLTPDSEFGASETITVNYTANAGSARSSVITITGAFGGSDTVTVNQSGATPTTSPISLAYSDVNAPAACSNIPLTYHVNQGANLLTAVNLYTNSLGTNNAPPGWYSDQSSWRYWNGSQFTLGDFCGF